MKNLEKLKLVKNKIGQHLTLSAEDSVVLKEHRVRADNIDFAFQPYYYEGANPTADCLIILDGKILLIQRADDAVEGGKWAIPGGFVDTTAKYGEVWAAGMETPLDAAVRELKEEANLSIESLDTAQFVGVFEGSNRDPRDNPLAWSKSHAFVFPLAHISAEDLNGIKAMSDAKGAAWFSLSDLPQLAFDHATIIEATKDLLNYRRSNNAQITRK